MTVPDTFEALAATDKRTPAGTRSGAAALERLRAKMAALEVLSAAMTQQYPVA